MSAALVAACCMATLLVMAQSAPGQAPEPPRVTTHTGEYCSLLSARVAAMYKSASAPPPQAVALASDGERLCAQGHYRHGIGRLRRALVLLQGSGAPSPR